MDKWTLFKNGQTLGKKGSENGMIVCDEEYAESCRITLEKTAPIPYSITCGIYGFMCHTVFADTESEARVKYDPMKTELKDFIETDPVDTDALTWVKCFVEKW